MLQSVRSSYVINRPYPKREGSSGFSGSDQNDGEKKKRRRKSLSEFSEASAELGPEFVPITTGDLAQKQIISTLNKDADFKETFLKKLVKNYERATLLKALNFLDDPEWKIRFELAKILRKFLFKGERICLHETIAALNQLENDSDSVVRLYTIETFKKHRELQSKLAKKTLKRSAHPKVLR